jgi:hypothetical protein
MGQHNSFGKDIDLLSEAYGQILGGAHIMQGTGVAGQAAQHMASEDGEDKTGGKSDHDLLDSVEKKHTAGKALLDKARSELDHNGSLSSHTRDSLARDEYASWADEDAEMIHGNKPLTSREKAAHSQGKGPYKQQPHNPWDDLPEGWDDEDAEDTDEADAGPEAKRRKDEDEKAAQQGFRGKPATPAH